MPLSINRQDDCTCPNPDDSRKINIRISIPDALDKITEWAACILTAALK